MGTLIFVVVLFVFAWLFLVMPSRRRQRSHAAMQDSIAVGDEIITAGGIHGTVTETGIEDVRLEIAPGVVVVLDRRAIAAVADELPDEPEDGPDEDGVDEGEVDDDGELDQAEESLKG
jgi:preprotein translocase subunit YajC